MRAIQDIVIQSFDGEDHRMFWAAYEDTCLECGAWEKYFESKRAYNKLTEIKRCVDPNDLFKFRMSMPTYPWNEPKSAKGTKGTKGTKGSKTHYV